MDAMAAWLCGNIEWIIKLSFSLNYHLVSVTFNRKAPSGGYRLCEQFLVTRKNSIAIPSVSVAQFHLCNGINDSCFRIA